MTPWRRFVRWRTHAAYWEQSAATNHLQNAWSHLCRVCWDCASARERKCLLPEDQEALDILHELAKESLDGQCQIIMTEVSVKKAILLIAVGPVIVALALVAAKLSFLYDPVPHIQPRSFTPHGEHECDLWPEQAIVCVAGDHFYIAGMRFEGSISSLGNCRFDYSKHGTWTVSNTGGGEACKLNGKSFMVARRGPEDYGVRQ